MAPSGNSGFSLQGSCLLFIVQSIHLLSVCFCVKMPDFTRVVSSLALRSRRQLRSLQAPLTQCSPWPCGPHLSASPAPAILTASSAFLCSAVHVSTDDQQAP